MLRFGSPVQWQAARYDIAISFGRLTASELVQGGRTWDLGEHYT